MQSITAIGFPPIQQTNGTDPRQAPSSSEEQQPSKGKEQIAALSQAELKQLAELKRRDQEVRAHEQAHKAAAGQYARGGASFTYQRGPDGQRYAIGGEVSIDISPETDPQATLQKALIVKRAALAPAEPSGQDRRIAMQAEAMAADARKEILQEQQEQTEVSTQDEFTAGRKEQRAIESFTGVANATLQSQPDNFEFVV